MLKQKNYENYQLTNQILLLYVLIIFAVLFIFYQRMSINNLNQLIYILKYNNFLIAFNDNLNLLS